MSPAPKLQVVSLDTGEIVPQCEACRILEVQLRGAERDIKTWRARCDDLERDKEREAAEDAHWPAAVRLFNEWRILLNHRGCHWSADRFWLVYPFLKKDGLEMCRRSIAGYWYDAWLAPARRNGTRRRVDEWEYIFGLLTHRKQTRKNFEEGARKAPANWQALFVDEDSLKRYAAIPFEQRKPPEPLPVKEAAPVPGSLFA